MLVNVQCLFEKPPLWLRSKQINIYISALLSRVRFYTSVSFGSGFIASISSMSSLFRFRLLYPDDRKHFNKRCQRMLNMSRCSVSLKIGWFPVRPLNKSTIWSLTLIILKIFSYTSTDTSKASFQPGPEKSHQDLILS